MKYIVIVILLIISIVSAISIFFTSNQVVQEESRMTVDLQYRSTLLAESLRESVEPNFLNKSNEYLQSVVARFGDKERFAGLAIYDNKGATVAASATISQYIAESQKFVTESMDGDIPSGGFITAGESTMYVFAMPMHENNGVVGALMIVQNADYIRDRLNEIWKTNLIRVLVQVLMISLVIFIISKWVVYEPLRRLVSSMEQGRYEGSFSSKLFSFSPLYRPLVREISTLGRNLLEARLRVSEEARLGLEKIDSPWTEERLKVYIKQLFKDRKFILVSNREPYIHTKIKNEIAYFVPASGMVTAVEPIMQACGGTWIAHGSGDADRLVVDVKNKIRVPPDEPKYELKRVWLNADEENGYYYGFSNEGMWPLCHTAHTRPVFRKTDWMQYQRVNEKFAETTLREIKHTRNPIILIQDFHFALLPKLIKKKRPDATVSIFWHVPWPNAESFSICPFRKELLEGMLGADLIGFHTQLHCNNFIDTVSRELEALIDLERFAVTKEGHSTYIKSFPISIAFTNGNSYQFADQSAQLPQNNILKELGIRAKHIGLGVDRLDYTKGILERFKAIEYFLDNHKSYNTNFTFIQVAPMSRSKIKRYQQLETDVVAEAQRINDKFKEKDWQPIVLLKKRHNHEELQRLYQIADVCMVTSLHDGMNLVSKEFVAARDDEKGVLILSQFAGASRELDDALIVNPYNIEQMADALHASLTMPVAMQTKRMKRMREKVRMNNVYRWSADLLRSILNLTH